MESGTLLGVVGLLATIIFGLLSVILVIRRRYPGELTFIPERTISLFDEIVKNLPEVVILYQSRPISERLVLLRGSLLNTGSKDVEPGMVIAPLRALLPAGFSWLQTKIISASPGVDAQVVIKDNLAIEFQLGFFRRNEFVRVEALAEVPPHPNSDPVKHPATQLMNTLTFVHRIAETSQVVIGSQPSDFVTPRTRFALAAFLGLMSGITFSFSNHAFDFFEAVTIIGMVVGVLLVAFPGIYDLIVARRLRKIIGYR